MAALRQAKKENNAATKLQAHFKGFTLRKSMKSPIEESKDDLPDLKDKGVRDAAVKIQSAFRGHKVRRAHKKSPSADDLPDLNDRGVQNAATKIQAAFR